MKIYLLFFMGLLFSFVNVNAKKKPNLLIIHTDEHSFRTLSCYQNLMSEDQAFVWGKGNNVTTPHIDRIANEGAICMNYYASSPVCTPSRASLVSGLYPQATGAPKNGMSIRQDITTFADILLDEGYATSYVGKWHLDGHRKYKFDIKYKAGFDDNRYMMTGGHAPYFEVKGDKVRGLGKNEGEKLLASGSSNIEYATDFFTDRTLEILERDKNKAFCLMLSIPDPHTPDAARNPYVDEFKDMPVQQPETMSAVLAAQKPSWGKTSPEDHNEATTFDASSLRHYFGMVKCIDENVGRILNFLDENKLTENTIVVFTSDHGDMFFEHNRRNKGVPYEASARIPFVIRFPKKIKAGKILRKAYTNVDFTPTILSLMDVKTDTKFHGENTAEDYINSTQEVIDDRIVYFAKNGGWWVCAANNRYKLILDKKEKPWLFDLEIDPNELTNYYNDPAYKDISKKLQDELMLQMKNFDEPGLKSKPYIL